MTDNQQAATQEAFKATEPREHFLDGYAVGHQVAATRYEEALARAITSHDNLYIALFGGDIENAQKDIAIKPAIKALADLRAAKAWILGPYDKAEKL